MQLRKRGFFVFLKKLTYLQITDIHLSCTTGKYGKCCLMSVVWLSIRCLHIFCAHKLFLKKLTYRWMDMQTLQPYKRALIHLFSSTLGCQAGVEVMSIGCLARTGKLLVSRTASIHTPEKMLFPEACGTLCFVVYAEEVCHSRGLVVLLPACNKLVIATPHVQLFFWPRFPPQQQKFHT